MKNCVDIHTAAIEGDVECLRRLIEKGVDINARNEEGRTPLQEAAYGGHLDAVKLLIDAGAEVHVTDDSGDTPMDFALYLIEFPSYPEIIRLLVDTYIRRGQLDATFDEGRTLLYFAIVGGSLKQVKALLDLGLRKVYVDEPPDIALQVAASSNRIGILKYLIKNVGLDPNAQDSEYGDTILHHAADSGNLRLVRFIVEELGLDPDVRNFMGFTPLHMAAAGGFLEVVKYLLSVGADINARDNDGNTPLHHAATWGNIQVISHLVLRGASTTVRNKKGKKPCDITPYPEVRFVLGFCGKFFNNKVYLRS